MLNIVTVISLTVRELENQYGLEGMIDANIIDVYDKVIMGIRDINKVLQDYEDHHSCTCKESRGKGYKCKKSDLKGTTVDEWKSILDH